MNKIKQALEAEIAALKEDRRFTGHKAPVDERINSLRAALAELEAAKPRPEVAPECATAPIIRGVHERWNELGYNDPDRAEERFRNSAWRAFYCGWIEGRWPLLVGEASKTNELTPGNGWISVEDRLPEDGVWVLTYSAGITDDLPWDIGYWCSGKWKCLGWDYPVTHWMPLPEPPNTLDQ